MSKEPSSPMDLIAAQIEAESAGQGGQPGADMGGQPPPEQISELQQKIEAGAAKVILAGLRIIRGMIAKKLPEIMDEWPDAMLQAPAEASIPLLREQAAKIMAVIGENEKYAMLAISLLPLVLGYVAATDRHAKAEASTVEAKPPAGDGEA